MDIINALQAELEAALSKDNDPYIRVEDAAKLIGADPNCLRQSIYNGTCPFGVGYGGTSIRNGYAKIPKLKFWHWMNGGGK